MHQYQATCKIVAAHQSALLTKVHCLPNPRLSLTTLIGPPSLFLFPSQYLLVNYSVISTRTFSVIREILEPLKSHSTFTSQDGKYQMKSQLHQTFILTFGQSYFVALSYLACIFFYLLFYNTFNIFFRRSVLLYSFWRRSALICPFKLGM